jgi:drug/metabolite transporter (DMT)-like permease
LVIATGSLVAATVLLLPVALFAWPEVPPRGISWLSAMLLAVFCTGIAYILYFRLLSRVGPSKALTVTYLVPVFGVLWGHVFLHEPVTTSMVLGCAVILEIADSWEPARGRPRITDRGIYDHSSIDSVAQ